VLATVTDRPLPPFTTFGSCVFIPSFILPHLDMFDSYLHPHCDCQLLLPNFISCQMYSSSFFFSPTLSLELKDVPIQRLHITPGVDGLCVLRKPTPDQSLNMEKTEHFILSFQNIHLDLGVSSESLVHSLSSAGL